MLWGTSRHCVQQCSPFHMWHEGWSHEDSKWIVIEARVIARYFSSTNSVVIPINANLFLEVSMFFRIVNLHCDRFQCVEGSISIWVIALFFLARRFQVFETLVRFAFLPSFKESWLSHKCIIPFSSRSRLIFSICRILLNSLLLIHINMLNSP